MKLEYRLILIFLFFGLFYSNCGPAGFQTNYNSVYSFSATPGVIGGNVVPLTVGCGYTNQLCAKVKVCAPGTTANCDTLNVLLDTGSTGLRVFASKLTNSAAFLTATTDPVTGMTLASCAVYGDAVYHWGAVKKASVVLGDHVNVGGLAEAAVDMSIQVIDYTFGDSGASCSDPRNAGMTVHTEVPTANYNGILGIKFFKQDCGTYCVSNNIGANPSYYGCNGTSCGTIVLPVANQMPNPIAALAGDNNGYLIDLPAIAATGATTAAGSLILGIGTQSNNTPAASVVKLPADPIYGNIKINFNGTTVGAIIDSGSSANFFQYTGFSLCATYPTYFCPTTNTSFYPTLYGASGTKSISTSFSVGNVDALFSVVGNIAFNNIAAPLNPGPGVKFNFGLPFFFGRKIYYGIENTGSPLGDGPFVGL